MEAGIWFWVAFLIGVAVMLAIDLGLFESGEEGISVRAATAWSAVWIGVSVAFGVGLWFWAGQNAAFEFFTAYVIEKSLSLDNIFVFVVIFQHFSVPKKYHHRVLFWGVIGAVVMRAAFILAGVALLARFDWVIYVFGVFLLYTAYRLARTGDVEAHPEENPIIQWLQNHVRLTDDYAGGKFFVLRDGVRYATPLLIVLATIETTDVIFAIDSVPAVLGVTDSAFIAFTSNILAVLGLRALYFVLSGTVQKFRYLDTALATVLGFVAVKMLLTGIVHIPIFVSLPVVLGIIATGIIASLVARNGEADETA